MPTDELTQCPRCGRRWPGLTAGALRGGCPLCLLEFAFTDADGLLPPADPAPPTRLGPYEIIEEIGRGGMGVVYRARHAGLGRVVALKVLHPACARQPGFPERFQREGQLLAALAHPHIVGVHDLGCEAGVYYLAMELVEGQTLRHGPLPWARAAEVFAQLCDAIAGAHERGIVHRDVKPENVLLDAAGRVKVGDFGIAKLVADGPGTPPTLTSTDALLGTRCYMAPEQLERGKDVGPAADVYALGAVLYEMLTGELPLGVFPPPSRRAAVGPRLDAVVLRALARDPAQRWPGARAFKEAVRRVGDRPPARQRAARAGVLAGALLLLALVVTLPGRWQAAPDLPRPTRAEAPPVNAVLTGHTAPVWCVAFDPDGKLLASASEDRTVKLWAPERGECVATLKALPGTELGPVRVAFAPDGKTLAAAGRENVVRLWDVPTRTERAVLTGHGREVNAVAFSPDGTLLASADQTQRVIVWDAAAGTKRHVLTWTSDSGQTHPILSLAFSPDGSLLAAGNMSGEIKLWDPATGAPSPVKWGHARRVWSLAFSPDGRLLASGCHDGEVKLWDVAAPKAVPRSVRVGPPVWAVAFSPDGRTLAAGGQDGIVRLWDVADGRRLAQLAGHADKVVSVAFAPDGRRLASASADQTVRLWGVPHERAGP